MLLFEIFTSYTSIILILVTFVLWHIWRSRKYEMLPPGPTPLPIIGNIFSILRSDTREAFSDLQKQYGDIFTLIIGDGILIVVNGLDTLKEMFIKNGDLYTDRPQNLAYSSLNKDLGVILTNGHNWKQQRRFSLTTLRDFGMGRHGMEERIAQECQVCIDKIKSYNGEAFDPMFLLMCCVSNVICATMFGKRYDHEDEEFVFHLKAVHDSAQKVGTASFSHFFPILKYFMERDLRRSNKRVKNEFNQVELDNHKKSFTENPNLFRDFIDAYFKEIKSREGDENSTFNEENLEQILGEFFFAGTETLTSTFRWALIYLSLYPEQQKAVQEELDRVVGRDRKPCMSDRKFLPITDATCLEIQRLADVVPFSVPHCVAKETVFKGYRIPPEAIILPNISSVLNSKEIWGDPEVFRPARFLKENNSLNRDANIPFSLGKRQCLGESLARMEIFLFLTALLQTFNFSLPKSDPSPCLKGVLGISRMPKTFRIIAVER